VAHQLVTNFPHDPLLDLEPWVGQRQASFRFERSNGVTGEKLSDIHPLRGASLSHDTSRVIKRQLTLSLGVVDTSLINPVTDRINPFMVFPNGAEYPLGRYMFTDASRQVFSSGIPSPHTAGGLANMTLNDEMFLVDQQIEKGINAVGESVVTAITRVLQDVDADYDLEATPYQAAEAWSIGTSRGSILESLSVSGDYFSPWFGNDSKLHFIRTFDPATKVPDLDYDAHNQVLRDAILETDDLLTAPNRFIVVSNAADDPDAEVVGTADVPSTAPHSITNRGFVIPQVENLQLSDATQATAVAQGLAQRFTVFERVGLTTPPDPRLDSYNVIRWQGDNWLELAWTMELEEGAAMSHLLRKSYSA
jgi:hypothetical protein